VLELRQHPTSVAFRAAVARLRRRAAKRAPSGAGGGGGSGSDAHAPPVRRAHSAGEVGAGEGAHPHAALARALSDTSTSGTDSAAVSSEEAGLVRAVEAAAGAMWATVQSALIPIDQQPLPLVDPLAAVTGMANAALRRPLATADSHARGHGDSAGSGGASGPGVPPAAAPFASPALWRLLETGVTVCKGAPIPPTFDIPSLAFPGMVPVVKSDAPSPSGAPHGDGGRGLAQGLAGPPPITCVEEVVVYEDPANKWLRLRFDRVLFPGGKTGRYNIVEEFGPARGQPGVVVLPITPRGELVLIRQYRYPVGAWSLMELPRGGPEPSRTSLQQARAELEEETGYGGGEWIPLPRSTASAGAGDGAGDVDGGSGGGGDPALMWVNTGVCSTEVAYWCARGVAPLATGSKLEDGEAIDRVFTLPLDEVWDAVADGEVRDQFTLAALGLAVAAGLIAPPLPRA